MFYLVHQFPGQPPERQPVERWELLARLADPIYTYKSVCRHWIETVKPLY